MKNSFVRLFIASATLAAALQLQAATLITRFDNDPLSSGWQIHGTNNLFAWNAANQNLQVTWDSSKPNNLFFLPLGATCTRSNDFLIAFEVNLNDIAVGTTPGYDLTYEIAVGLVNLQQATNAGFVRGSGFQAPNLVEWDYFPNDINNFGATVATTIISSNNAYGSGGFSFPVELATNATYAIRLTYTAADATLRSQMTSNGVPVGPLQNAWLGGSFDDFAVNALAIISYNDEGQFPGWEGSVLAHGTVDNVVFASPLPVQTISNLSTTEISLASDPAWNYTLESTTNLVDWTQTAPTVPGNGGTLVLQATNAPGDLGYYRVRADLP